MGSLSVCPLWLGVVVVVVMEVMVRVEGSLFNQPDWGTWSYLGEDCTLNCNQSHLPLQPANFIRWELPSTKLLEASDDKYVLKSDANAQVINMHLTIRNVQDTDSGVYLCHVYSTPTMNEKRGHVMRGLNIGGHLYRDPFDEYRHNVLVGCCTAAALCLLLSGGCLIYKFRYRSPKQPQGGHDASLHVTTYQRHLEDGKGIELPPDIDEDGEGQRNHSYDVMENETATKL